MLCSIPVYAVMVEDLGERGAHYMAYKEFCREVTPTFSGLIGKYSIHDSNDTEKSIDDFQFSDLGEVIHSSSSYLQGGSAVAAAGMVVCVIGAFLLCGINVKGRR